MTVWTGLLIALAVGLASALQTAMLGSMGRGRAPIEAAWVSLIGSIAGISLVMLVRALRGDALAQPPPFDRPAAYAAALALALAVLAISLRGLPWYYGLTGLGGVIYLATAALLVPRLGVAVFFGATTAGSVVGALAIDQFGAFGAAPIGLSLARVGGLALILVGVIVARLAR